MKSIFKTTLFTSFILINFGLLKQTHAQLIRSLRVDPGYFYVQYPGQSPIDISNQLISQAKSSGVNTLFVYAYNTVYGAYYPTTYRDTVVESGYGQLNILKTLTDAADNNGIKVIAVIPINNFKQVWLAHSSWRAKTRSGTDYIPVENTFLLSAWHPDFQYWLTGFCNDLLNRNPNLYGIEAAEPYIDYFWNLETDYNPVANKKFKSLYRRAKLGDATWMKFRAQGLTDLIGIMNTAAHNYSKKAFVVQNWPAKTDGSLFSSDVIRNYVGLDFNGILNLTGSKKLNYLMAELVWQHWASEYGPVLFTPAWTREVALTFIDFVNNRSIPIVHVEISSFTGSYGTVIPTLQEFIDTLVSIRDLNVGIDVYDHRQVFDKNAWDALMNWNY